MTLSRSFQAGRRLGTLDAIRRIRARRKRAIAKIFAKRRPPSAANDIDLAMMEHAIGLANSAATNGEIPVAAVIYRGEEIIAVGANNRESSCDPTGHAEMIAIREAGQAIGGWRLTGCSMAVTLEPCPMCAGALVNARLDRLVYGARDAKAGACTSLYHIPTDARLNHRVEMIGGVLEPRCRELLRSFFRRRRAAKRKTA